MSWVIEEKGYSQRRARALVGIAPRVYRYQSTRPDDADLRQRLRELSSERRRFGYRRLHLLLRREVWDVNWKKLYRIYKEERLTVRKRSFRHLLRKGLPGGGWQEACSGNTGTDGDPAGCEPALVARLRVGRTG